MENKEIEQLLKESAEEVKVKDFSERWEKLKGRIDLSQQVELKETASETVLATSVNANISQNSIRKKLIISVCAVFLLIVTCLAVVLPLTLKNNDKIYFNLDELDYVPVSGDEFYENIEKSDLNIINIEVFNVESYVLLYTEDNRLVGGNLEIADEADGLYATLVFYDSSVKSSIEVDADFKSCEINGFKIDYKTELDEDELYSTTAKAVSSSISYEFECLSGDENIEGFFEKIFG